jgi:Fe-S cluster assembly iron-binding protein IscA
MIGISEQAHSALQDLLSREGSEDKAVRILVDDYT